MSYIGIIAYTNVILAQNDYTSIKVHEIVIFNI